MPSYGETEMLIEGECEHLKLGPKDVQHPLPSGLVNLKMADMCSCSHIIQSPCFTPGNQLLGNSDLRSYFSQLVASLGYTFPEGRIAE